MILYSFFFQAEDGIRDLVRSRGLGDVYKRQKYDIATKTKVQLTKTKESEYSPTYIKKGKSISVAVSYTHLTLPTSDLV